MNPVFKFMATVSICYVMDNFYDHDIEVIGNIYDNPELLEGDGSA